jgi:hypothetical protein
MTTDAKEVMTVPKKEQNAGVALLLERMKTNPEEFLTQEKWGLLINRYEKHLSEEDAKALTNAIDELMQQRFTELVLEELVLPKSEKSQREDSSVTLSAGATLGQSWVNTQLQQAQAIQNQQLHELLHNKALAAQNLSTTPVVNKKPVVKQHKTLFGKLFNYS